jgi:polyferredoxin
MDKAILNKDKLWNKIKKYLYYIIFLLSLLIVLLFYLVNLNKEVINLQKNLMMISSGV